MPQRPSAKKQLKQDKKRTARNKAVKSRLRTETKRCRVAMERGDDAQADRQLNLVTKLLHKAAAKGIISKNTAARNQSKLRKQLSAVREKA